MKTPLSIYRSFRHQYRSFRHQLSLRRRFGKQVSTFTAKELGILTHIAQTLDRFNSDIGIVYDIGAFNGMWSQAFALYTRSDVYAFEPLPAMVGEINKKVEIFPQIHVQPVACGHSNMKTVIFEDEHKTAASSLLIMSDHHKREFQFTGCSHPVPVTVVSLDEWRLENNLPLPTLVKIDVQGAEHDVIAGGVETFKHTRYVWIEMNFRQFYVGGSTFGSIYPILTEYGFELVDCVDLVRSRHNDQLLYMDGIFRKKGC